MRDERGDGGGRSEALARLSKPVVALDTDLRYTYVGDLAGQFFDADPASIVGRSAEEVGPDGGLPAEARRTIREAVETGAVLSYERHLSDRGWVEVEVHPGADGVTLLYTHVTARKEAEREREQFRRILDHLPVAVGQTDASAGGHFSYVNETMVEMFGTDSKADLKRRSAADIYRDPDDRAAVVEALRSDGHVDEREIEFETVDGEQFWGAITATRVEIDGEEHVFKIVQDVTERREHEAELERKTRAMAEVPVGIIITDPDQEDNPIIYANQHFLDLTGYPEDEILGRNCRFLQGPETSEETIATMREAIEADEPVTVEIQNYRKDGSEFWNRVVIAPVEDDGTVTNYVGFQQDVTDRRRRERELARYEELVENVPVGIYRNTPGADGTFLEVNPAMVEMFDAGSRAELLECAVSDLYADPEDRQRVSETLREEGVIVEEELGLETLSGDHFWASVTAIASGTGDELSFDGVLQDITERKEYEERLEEQRDNLDLLNQMVRHDIRNDLQLVLAYAEMLRDHADDEAREYIETILESTEHAVSLTRTARDLAQVMLRSDADPEGVALDHVLERELDDVRSTHSDSVVTVEGRLPDVSVRADQMLDSVIRNLLQNAIQHNDEDVPEVTVSVTECDESVRIRIADNGPGVPKNQKEDIFGRGEKGLESEGSGLGLYLVSTLVEGYGGDVRVEDNDPEGAVFVVELPTVG